ncbi:MAG: hypothetical protein H6R17_982 [Proteobacteria bacterium]|nr:hypothetical protein [Pseudomonadota bacterium]
MGTYTLGRLAKQTRMARSSLLHYEELGLLLPASRSAAGYRLYGEQEIERLQAIRSYRDAGLPLSAIRELLAEEASDPARILSRRLVSLNDEITRLRAQQMQLARLLTAPAFRTRRWTHQQWVGMLRDAGFDDEDMHNWHVDFEAGDAPAHAAFLRALDLPADAVANIRLGSRTGQKAASQPSSADGRTSP